MRRTDRRLHALREDGKLHYDYNAYNMNAYALTSPPLAQGQIDVKFLFKKTGMGQGVAELRVNGKRRSPKRRCRRSPFHFLAFGDLRVGADYGSAVSKKLSEQGPALPVHRESGQGDHHLTEKTPTGRRKSTRARKWTEPTRGTSTP